MCRFRRDPGIVAKHLVAGGQQDRYLVIPQAPVGGETMAQRDDGRVREPDQFIDHLKVAKINPHGASPSNRSPGRREIRHRRIVHKIGRFSFDIDDTAKSSCAMLG